MSELFSDKKGKVIVVDPSGPVRQMMSDVVRGLGFSEVEAKASVQDLLQFLEVEAADWVILPLASDQEVNGVHALKIISEVPQLKKTRVSFILEEEERDILPTAFEYGLLSYHDKPFTKDTLPKDLGGLLEKMEANEWSETVTSADYLRTVLAAREEWESSVALDKALVNLYPGKLTHMLSLARSLKQSGDVESSKGILIQAKYMAGEQGASVDEVAQELFETTELTAEGSDVNILGIDSVVIVDSDDAIAKELEEIFTEMGVKDIKVFDDGEKAWDVIKEAEEPGLIIQEWRIPKLSGPYFVQKVRHHGFNSVPILILSSLLKPADMPLVKEMGVANVIAKPLAKDTFVAGILWTIQQERSPSEHGTLERKIRTLLAARKKSEAEPLKNEYLAAEGIPMARKRLIEAEFAFANGDFDLAREAAVDALKSAGDSILVLNLLGKIFMALSEFESALKCFKKAQELSPKNVERLCSIAEAHTELGQEEEAKEALEEATELDESADAVREAKVKCALAKGDTEAAKEQMGELESLSTLLGYMNNKAVALSKTNHFDEAITLYENTIKSIPDDKVDLIAVVKYNLALAFVRSSEFERALEVLNDALKVEKSRITKKGKSLQARLQKSIDKGSSLELANGKEEQPAEAKEGEAAAPKMVSEDDLAAMVAQVEAKAGERCCFKVFFNPKGLEEKAKELIKNQPRFQFRSAIEREEALGAEKTSKAS